MKRWRVASAAPAILILLLILTGTAGGCRQATTQQPAPTTEKPRAQTTETVAPEAAIAYFEEVVLGTEYGENGQVVHKWPQDLRIQVKGSPTEQDIATLNQVMAEINGLVEGIELKRASWNDNVQIYFVPESKFSSYEPNYVPTNYGFFWTWWGENQEIYRARILISTDKITQAERSHLIREELTQSLGLMKDSAKYPESVFFQNWTATTEYAPIDRSLIEMLYSGRIKAGMNQEQALAGLRSLQTNGNNN